MRHWIDLFEQHLEEISHLADWDFSERQRQEHVRMLLGYHDWTVLARSHNGAVYKWRDSHKGAKDILISVDRRAIGYALLEPYRDANLDIDGYFVTEIGLTRWEHEGNGYGKALYDCLLSRGMTLVSGFQQTASGRKMWERLIGLPGIEVTAVADDQLVDVATIDPWQNPDTLLIAKAS